MILSDIKRYLMQHRRAPLQDIALHFDADPSAVEGMLEHWVRKGRVRKFLADEACGSSCHKCDPAAMQIYEWVESSLPPEHQ